MQYLKYIHLFCFTLYLVMAFYVYLIDRRSKLNNVGAFLFLSICVWSFSAFISSSNEFPFWFVQRFVPVGIVATYSYSLALMWMIMVLTRHPFANSRYLYLYVFASTGIIMFFQIKFNLIYYVRFIESVQYYELHFSNIFTLITTLVFNFHSVFALVILGRYIIKNRNNRSVNRASLIFWTTLAVSIINIIFLIIPAVLKKTTHSFADFSFIIITVGLFIAIKKYDLFVRLSINSFYSLLDTFPDPVVILNARNYITEVNDKFAELIGWKSIDIKGKMFPFILADGEEERFYLQYFKEKLTIKSEKVMLLAKHGNKIPVLLSSTHLTDDTNKMQYRIVFIVDIRIQIEQEATMKRIQAELENKVAERTMELGVLNKQLNARIEERDKLVKQLEGAKKKAEESDHLKSVFLANMSHEIRTPMNGILGFAELMQDEENRDKQKHYINVILNRGEHLLNILNDIIDISKLEADQMRFIYSSIPLSEFFEQLYAASLFDMKKKNNEAVSLVMDIPEDNSLVIRSDRTKLQQVFINLINNAIKFVEKGYISFGYKMKNGNPLFFVKDTGPGIPQEKQGIIFERFRQSEEGNDRNHEGTGLGLAICKGIIAGMGGRIWVESKFGEGATFFFSLDL